MASMQVAQLPPGVNVTGVCVGQYSICALLNNVSIACFGQGYYGAIGSGANVNVGDTIASMTPLNIVSLPAGLTPVSVVCGITHTCAILKNGRAYCWGFAAGHWQSDHCQHHYC